MLLDDNRICRIENGVPFDTLRMLYQGADMFVLPSTYEGFGLPVLEAMMAGVPVVVPRKASLPEVSGQCAIYVDPLTVDNLGRKIVECSCMDKNDRQVFIQQARQWAERFSWEKSARETLAVLKLALEE